MRIVVDTNVVVSAVLTTTGPCASVLDMSVDGSVEMLASDEILDEYDRVLRFARVRARHGLTEEQVSTFVRRLRGTATLVTIDERIEAVGAHPADDKFVECAVAGGADYIVSGDDDLLALREFRGIRVVTPRLFLSLLPSV